MTDSNSYLLRPRHSLPEAHSQEPPKLRGEHKHMHRINKKSLRHHRKDDAMNRYLEEKKRNLSNELLQRVRQIEHASL